MSLKILSRLTAIMLALPLAPIAAAQEMDLRQAALECHKPRLNCRGMNGQALQECVAHNARIQRACNIMRHPADSTD